MSAIVIENIPAGLVKPTPELIESVAVAAMFSYIACTPIPGGRDGDQYGIASPEHVADAALAWQDACEGCKARWRAVAKSLVISIYTASGAKVRIVEEPS